MSPLFRTDELLHHDAFLRAVASRLVAADDVDDLVQSTWLATAERGPSRPGRIRAWLATVARNLAGKARRGTERRVLVLSEAGAAVEGRVSDSAGAAIVGATVEATATTPEGAVVDVLRGSAAVRGQTDADGRFRLESLPAGPIHITAHAAGFAVAVTDTDVSLQRTERVSILLRRGARLVGQSKGPVSASTWIRVRGTSRATVLGRIAEDGSFTIEDVPPGKAVAQWTDGGQILAATELVFEEEATTRWDPVVTTEATIVGRVVDAAGLPMPGQHVSVQRRFGSAFVTRAVARTDAGGRFRVAAKDRDAVRLEVVHAESGAVLGTADDVLPGGPETTIVVAESLRPTAHVIGRLLHADGAPATDGVLMIGLDVRGDQEGALLAERPTENGAFRLGPYPAGRIRLVFEAGDDRAPFPLGDRIVAAGETWELGEIRLPDPVVITVKVLKADETPDAESDLVLCLPDGSVLGRGGRTDLRGEARLAIPPTACVLVASGDARRAPAWMELGSGRAADAEAQGLLLRRTAPPATEIRGLGDGVLQVRLPSGVPLASAPLKHDVASIPLPPGVYDFALRSRSTTMVKRYTVAPNAAPLTLTR